MKNMTIMTAAITAATAVIVAIPAFAQEADGGWRTFEKDGRCWASSAPESSSGSIPGRSSPYLSIQNFPGEGMRGSVAVVSGFESEGDVGVTLEVNGKPFDVLPFKGAAFTASGKPEAALISAMRRGKELVVTWTDASGAAATDRYSLMGFSAAKEEIDRNCR